MDENFRVTEAPWDRGDAASRSLLRLIAQSTNDGIWDWDLLTGEVYYSPRWLELVGFLPGELPSNIDGFVDRVHPDDRALAEQTIEAYLGGRLPEYKNEFRLRHKDGSWRSILSRGVSLSDAAGRPIRFAGTHTDVTDRVRAAERLEVLVAERTADLRAARDRAELASATTTKFLMTASHDIRQPLQAMALLVGGLEGKIADDAGRQTLHAVERALGSSMELLDALLEYSQLDAGAMRPYFTTVNIGDLFDVLDGTFAAEAARKGLDLKIVGTGLATRSDGPLLGRILRNLVSNAIKYTDHGRILVGCRLRGNHVRVEVWDTGHGISPEHQRQIFWEFVQVKESGRPRRGLGLGLAIVDRLTKLLGHKVEVRSWPGKGSVFAIEMVRELPMPSSVVLSSGKLTPDGIFVGKLIAVLEDDAAVAAALSRLLTEWGSSVVTADHDQALLGELAGRVPDAVIADRHLSEGCDGFEALDRLELEFARPLPSLVLTADYDLADLERLNKAGRRVLNKPVWPAVLHSVMLFELNRLAGV